VSLTFTKQNVDQVQHEDALVVKKTDDLKAFMRNRLQENVQMLVKIIEEDIAANQEEMT